MLEKDSGGRKGGVLKVLRKMHLHGSVPAPVLVYFSRSAICFQEEHESLSIRLNKGIIGWGNTNRVEANAARLVGIRQSAETRGG